MSVRVMVERAEALSVMFEHSNNLSRLDEAVIFAERALAADPRQADVYHCLCHLYVLRFNALEARTDLERAVECGEKAVELANGTAVAAWTRLGNALLKRFERDDGLADLTHAIAAHRRAVDETGAEDPSGFAGRSCNLSNAYRLLYSRRGDPADLDLAVEIAERAVHATPSNSPVLPIVLTVLSIAFQVRAADSGDLDDLRRGIEAGERAVETTPAGHPEFTGRLSNLGLAYTKRFRFTRASSDADRAVALLVRAVAETPASDPALRMYLTNLSAASRWRFERSGNPADIRMSIETGEQAVAAATTTLEKARWANNLCNAYRAAFDATGERNDISRAIDLGERVMAEAPADHPERPQWANNAAGAYQLRFRAFQAHQDLARAIELGEYATGALPLDAPVRGLCLTVLYTAYQLRFDITGKTVPEKDLREAAAWITEAALLSPVHSVLCAFAVGRLANHSGAHDVARVLLDFAVSKLPSVAPWGLARADQEHELADLRGLAAETIAAHLWNSDPVGAVEHAELARGILISAELEARSDLTDLTDAHPLLAEELERARHRLTAPLATNETPHERNDQYNRVLGRVRAIPGFADFLLPQGLQTLKDTVGHGAAVVVNTSRSRSDAIIITATTDPVVVSLPDLSAVVVEAKASKLLAATQASTTLAEMMNQEVMVVETLAWLWDVAVKKILMALPEHVNRVWWLPIGAIGLLPLHAAGHLGRPGALQRVVSSYIPTIRALGQSASTSTPAARQQLVVSMPQTPGLLPLPHTAAEAAALAPHGTNDIRINEHEATSEAVLACLRSSTRAHFACHASADLAHPSQGGLHLYDGTLTIASLSDVRLDHAELAYLSACSTANSGLRHADEVINLASSFHLAGFRHVVATMWPVGDEIAANAARAFYRHLADDGAAVALNRAVAYIRECFPDQPNLWAPFVHSGS